MRRDIVYALKSLRRAPGYTIVTLLTLALGIGANSAIFAAVDTILLRPMPYAHADRLVVPLSVHAARDIDTSSVSYADYVDWRQAIGHLRGRRAVAADHRRSHGARTARTDSGGSGLGRILPAS